MTEGVEGVVTEVLASHLLGNWVVEKGYECLKPDGSAWVRCGWFGERHNHAAHVAAAVVEALGLTEERKTAERCNCTAQGGSVYSSGCPVHDSRSNPGGRQMRRWASPWVAVERGHQ